MSRQLFVFGYVAVLALGVAIELSARAGRVKLPRLDDVLRFVQQTKTGRVAVFVAWFWLGFHFLAR